jgi:uncharacterized protein (TIGR03435 family)
MADFAGLMQGAVLDKPVVDQTGLTGRYDFTLELDTRRFAVRGMGAQDSAAQPTTPMRLRICTPQSRSRSGSSLTPPRLPLM